jgi:sulfur-oxidizing protein SoxY
MTPQTTLRQRRAMLKQGGLMALLAGSSLVSAHADTVATAAMATGEDAAFGATTLQGALRGLCGVAALSDIAPAGVEVTLSLPELAENGAVVPVTVASSLPGTQAIAIVVELNPQPLVVQFKFPIGTEAFVATRIKLAASGRVYALVQAQDKLYAAYQDTKVVLSGCG